MTSENSDCKYIIVLQFIIKKQHDLRVSYWMLLSSQKFDTSCIVPLLIREVNYEFLEITPFLEDSMNIFGKSNYILNSSCILVFDMEQQLNHALEVQQELEKLNVIPADSTLVSYKRAKGGGAAHMLFELCFEDPPREFLQKISTYKDGQEYLELEYNTLKILFENNLSVPQPVFIKLVPNTRNLPYFIMEKIEGVSFAEVKGKNPDLYEQLTEKQFKELLKIHNLDLSVFPSIPIPNIVENPYAAIDEKLSIFKLYLDGFPKELEELLPVYKWLVENKFQYPCKELVVTHGDFHSFNIMVGKNQELIIIDWGAISITDFRMDVAYSVTTESYIDDEQISDTRMKRAILATSIYEKLSGKKIEGLAYFMILACNFNLIRLYSQINNPNITGENEDTAAYFHTVKDYFLFIAYVIEETCNVELKQIKEYFSLVKEFSNYTQMK